MTGIQQLRHLWFDLVEMVENKKSRGKSKIFNLKKMFSDISMQFKASPENKNKIKWKCQGIDEIFSITRSFEMQK